MAMDDPTVFPFAGPSLHGDPAGASPGRALPPHPAFPAPPLAPSPGAASAPTPRPPGLSVLVLGLPADSASHDWLGGLRLSWAIPPAEASFQIATAPDDRDLELLLAQHQPRVILTLGDVNAFPKLWRAPLEYRRRWIHIDDRAQPPMTPPSVAAQQIWDAASALCIGPDAGRARFAATPLVSILTRIEAPADPSEQASAALIDALGLLFQSLVSQDYDNWQWVVYDESGLAADFCASVAHSDARITRLSGPPGTAGVALLRLCGCAEGAIHIRLDPDGQLAPRALARMVRAAQGRAEVGCFYGDLCDLQPSGLPVGYPAGYPLGFGGQRNEVLPGPVAGPPITVQVAPPINAKTIRHHTGLPQGAIGWKREALLACGGPNPLLDAGAEQELFLRLFLTTRIARIGHLCSLRRRAVMTPARIEHLRRLEAEQARMNHLLVSSYDRAIHERLERLEIGPDADFCWNGQSGDPSASPPEPIESAPAASIDFVERP